MPPLSPGLACLQIQHDGSARPVDRLFETHLAKIRRMPIVNRSRSHPSGVKRPVLLAVANSSISDAVVVRRVSGEHR
jgi:hypothetical protein